MRRFSKVNGNLYHTKLKKLWRWRNRISSNKKRSQVCALMIAKQNVAQSVSEFKNNRKNLLKKVKTPRHHNLRFLKEVQRSNPVRWASQHYLAKSQEQKARRKGQPIWALNQRSRANCIRINPVCHNTQIRNLRQDRNLGQMINQCLPPFVHRLENMRVRIKRNILKMILSPRLIGICPLIK